MVPDYTGYDGVVLDRSQIISYKPTMEILGRHEFKYGIDLEGIKFDSSTAAILCSRPCNPTGNVLTDDEMSFLARQAKELDIPLLVDSAYAPPFPNLAFVEMNPVFNANVIHCVSLSKAGLAGERVGFAIGHKRYIEQIEPFLSNAGIHSSRFGQALATKALRSGRLVELSEIVIKPLYRAKSEIFRDALNKHLPNELSWWLHRCEGGMFSWLWVETKDMNDLEMYKIFKSQGLLCVPGSAFFPGLSEEWPHRHRCLRFSMTASDEDLLAAARIIGRELEQHREL
jgi:valine--pyruvate aminotransferase